jgi:rhomboid protease GluP
LLRAGEWWRIITSQFLHVHLLHMLFNMLAVLLLGIMLERALGSWRLLLLYIVSGTIGQLAGVMSTPALVSSGASQAAVGLAGGMFIQWLRQSRKKSLSLIALLFIVGVQTALDLISSGRIKAGHLAGFCAGAAITYLMSRSLKEKI